MTIDIELKPLEVQVNIKGYGDFYVRRIGAAMEALINEQLSNVQKQLDDFQKNNAELLSKESKLINDKNLQELENLRATAEYQELSKAQKLIDNLLADAIRQSNKIMMDCWRSDVDGVVEKLFNDLTMDQIKSAYQQIMTEANNA